MTAGGEDLLILEERVKKLEDKVFGPLPKDAECPEVVSTLASLGSQLGSALGTRDRMMMVMKRLDELERYLDPSYGESLELSDTVKLDLVLAHEEQLRNQHQQLNTMNSLKHILDSQHISDAASLGDELVQIANRHSHDEEAATQQSLQIKNMLDQYNSIINTLTETFIKMDEIVTKAEIAAIPKKAED
ncbi:dynactin subunit 3-like [Panulirus ornatus]